MLIKLSKQIARVSPAACLCNWGFFFFFERSPTWQTAPIISPSLPQTHRERSQGDYPIYIWVNTHIHIFLLESPGSNGGNRNSSWFNLRNICVSFCFSHQDNLHCVCGRNPIFRCSVWCADCAGWGFLFLKKSHECNRCELWLKPRGLHSASCIGNRLNAANTVNTSMSFCFHCRVDLYVFKNRKGASSFS